MVSDGVLPSNTERGYVLRKLIRRASIQTQSVEEVVKTVMNIYNLSDEKITKVIVEEAEKFNETLSQGLKQYEKGRDPFTLVTSFGLPFDEVKKLTEQRGIKLDEKEFQEKFKEHQEISKAGMEQKFKGGLAGHSDIEVRYHTATHLLHQALRDILGSEVTQKGSNITPERLRFDFAFPRKMTEEEKNKVEEIVNNKIKEALPVENKVMKKDEAIELGALHFFDQKYPDEVSVYTIGNYSKEFCGGPHVKNTREIGVFKIAKEEAVSAGVRRIKATLQ